ncbi:MAG: cysteine desulfurase family protein [Candidatus Aenigmarchaeota archaeon]|nr:cysteine desulfurase family protein [Candidatus Aenigmarchaeota archaeon]
MEAYLDNGATTKVDPRVLKAMMPYFSTAYGNASSLHKPGRDAKKAMDLAREAIAKKLNAEAGEIIFTSGGTESDNLAIRGAAYANRGKGKHIITTKIEHPAVLNTCRSLANDGFDITFLDVDDEGLVDISALEKAIKKDTILVSVIHGNNEVGTIQDIACIGALCRQRDVLFHTDAVQSFGKVPIDVKRMNIDLLSISGHKFNGPKGIGALYVRSGVKLTPLAYGGHHEFGLRPGTENIPGIVGLAKAAELIGTREIKQMAKLRDTLIKGLLSIHESYLNGPGMKNSGRRLCNNANVSFKGVEGEALLMYLDTKGVRVSTGSACSSRDEGPSHVLSALNVDPECIMGSLRFTLSKFTTRQEIDYTVKATKETVAHLRKVSGLRSA